MRSTRNFVRRPAGERAARGASSGRVGPDRSALAEHGGEVPSLSRAFGAVGVAHEQAALFVDACEHDEVARAGEIARSHAANDGGAGQESAANLSFRDKSTLPMRVWLRVAVSVLPILLLILSLDIQKRKFIIDEDYYDMMVESIKAREGNG